MIFLYKIAQWKTKKENYMVKYNHKNNEAIDFVQIGRDSRKGQQDEKMYFNSRTSINRKKLHV